MHALRHVFAGAVKFVLWILRSHGFRVAKTLSLRIVPPRVAEISPFQLIDEAAAGQAGGYSRSVESLDRVIDPSWARALAPVEDKIHELGAQLRAEVEAGHGYLPAGSDVLRAFTYPLDQVKVLIVGQDPYPTPGHAMGLSFSVAPGVPFPASLRNIFKELTTDVGVPMPTSGDLTPWSRQGVCLLNRVLTVRPGQAGSHRKMGWEEVTSRAIDALVERRDSSGNRLPLVAILWGRDAQSLREQLGDTPAIESVHPSPLSARRGFFGSRPFSRANALLAQQGATAIDWRLP